MRLIQFHRKEYDCIAYRQAYLCKCGPNCNDPTSDFHVGSTLFSHSRTRKNIFHPKVSQSLVIKLFFTIQVHYPHNRVLFHSKINFVADIVTWSHMGVASCRCGRLTLSASSLPQLSVNVVARRQFSNQVWKLQI